MASPDNTTAEPTHDLRMPPRTDLVDTAIRRFNAKANTSKVLGLSDTDLHDAGMLLSDRTISRIEAWRKFNAGMGASEEDPVVAERTWYRFADRFASVYAQVEVEHAQRIARLSLGQATDGNIRDMTRLSRHRVVELLAEKLVATDNVAEVIKDLPKLTMALADAERAQHSADKLELDRLNYERRLSETEAKLELAERRSKLLQQQVEETEIKLRRSVEQAKQTVQAKAGGEGKELSADDVIAILDKVMKGEA